MYVCIYIHIYFATLRLANAFSKSKLNYSYATYASTCIYVHIYIPYININKY